VRIAAVRGDLTSDGIDSGCEDLIDTWHANGWGDYVEELNADPKGRVARRLRDELDRRKKARKEARK
jgi:hypothetical protein